MALININIENVEKIQHVRAATIAGVDDLETIENVETLNVVEPITTRTLTIRITPPVRRAGIGEGNMAPTAVTITDEQRVDVTYDLTQTKDAAGNAAPIDEGSTITAEVDDANIVSTEVNGNVVSIISEDKVDADTVGQTTVNVVITPPTGEPITDVVGVTVLPSAVSQISGSVGEPTQR